MHISTHLDPSRLADLARDPNHARAEVIDAAMLQLNGLRAERAERATLNSAGQAINAALRPAFDADYGSFNAHPTDPRTQPNELVGNMLEQINCAERALAMARQALEGVGAKVSTVAARQQMEEARDFLAVPR